MGGPDLSNGDRLVVLTSYYRARRYLPRYALALRLARARLPRELKPKLLAVVVMNDAPEWEAALLERLLGPVPRRILRVERESLYASWNRAILAAPEGRVFLPWNLDDARFAGGLAEQHRLCAEAEGPALAVSPWWELTYGLWPLVLRWRRMKPREGGMPPFFAVNRRALERVGLFNPGFRINGDTEWLARARAAGVPEPWGKRPAGVFCNHGGGLSHSARKENLAEGLLLARLHPGFKRSPLHMAEELERGLEPPPELPPLRRGGDGEPS
jgi:hypothetical protein